MNTLNRKNNYIQNYVLMGLEIITCASVNLYQNLGINSRKRRLYNMALFYMAMIVMLADIRKYGNEKLVTISRD